LAVGDGDGGADGLIFAVGANSQHGLSGGGDNIHWSIGREAGAAGDREIAWGRGVVGVLVVRRHPLSPINCASSRLARQALSPDERAKRLRTQSDTAAG